MPPNRKPTSATGNRPAPPVLHFGVADRMPTIGAVSPRLPNPSNGTRGCTVHDMTSYEYKLLLRAGAVTWLGYRRVPDNDVTSCPRIHVAVDPFNEVKSYFAGCAPPVGDGGGPRDAGSVHGETHAMSRRVCNHMTCIRHFRCRPDKNGGFCTAGHSVAPRRREENCKSIYVPCGDNKPHAVGSSSSSSSKNTCKFNQEDMRTKMRRQDDCCRLLTLWMADI